MRFVPLVRVIRNQHSESMHFGVAAAIRRDGSLVAKWGDPATPIFPPLCLETDANPCGS